jgi:homoserine kinase
MLMGLVNSDGELLKNAFVDLLAQPYRSKAIPHFEELLTVAKEKKTLGFGLSGSGPTLFAASLGKKIAEDVANGMRAVFEKYNEQSKGYISSVNVTGAIILSEK